MIRNLLPQAVVVITCQMCKQEDSEEVWRANTQELLKLTGDIPLGLYECPKPYLRLLSPGTSQVLFAHVLDTLRWVVDTGRFYFHKDVSCSISKIREKLQALQNAKPVYKQSFKFYNANMATLLASMELGAHGFAGIAANFYPHLIGKCTIASFPIDSAWMLQNYKVHSEPSQLLQRFLSLSEMTVAHKYPQSAKLYVRLCEKGFKNINYHCRTCR